MDPILELRNVRKCYDGFLLDDISFSLPKGCIMGFVGENGAGKSTVIKLILNLIHRDGGDIFVFGQDNRKADAEIKERVGIVFDESNFPENFKVADVNSIMQHLYRNWDASQFNLYVKRFSLPLDKTVKTFSRGMKMKLSLAVALSHQAQLLLLDEATSGLDPMVRDELLDLFLEFIQNENHSILISTHIISDLSKAADYITLIHEGKLLFSQPKDLLREKYGVLRCSKSEFQEFPAEAIIGFRKNEFGVEALIQKDKLHSSRSLEQANLEDIMLFYIRGETR